MVNLQKSGDSAVKFVFTDSDHYLYGNGEVEVPVNSLLLVIDESDMVTFKKLSGDPFLSFRADNSNLGTKAAIEQFYKENMVGSTGGGSESGITSGEVQTMIDNSLEDYYTDDEVDAALSGKASVSDVTALENEVATKADTSAVTAVANDVQTVSGQVATKVATSDFNTYTAATETALNGKVDTSALNDYYTKTEVYNKQEVDAAYGTAYQALTAHTADTTVHVTSAEKTTWNNKSDFSGDYNDLTNKPTIPTVPTNISDFTNDAGYITNADITGKADTSAVTQVNNVLTAHTANTTVHVSQVEKAAWNAKANIDHVTQAEYSAMEQAGTLDSNTMYIIDDAVPFDPSTKVDVSAITSSITSGSTDSEIPTAKAVYDATQSGGGGATYSAGQGISIDTANTISFAVPIYSGVTGNVFHPTYNNNSIIIGNSNNRASNVSVAGGNACTGQSYSFTYGHTNNATGEASVALGNRVNATNDREAAFGSYNVSNKANTTFGDSGNTLFSVGNGTGAGTNARHNAFEIRQNGDIYVNDGTNDVRLQDTILALGGLKLVKLTQNEYDQLATKDANTLYIISNVVS